MAPTLLRHAENLDVWIWSVDDDMVYSPGTLAGLLRLRASATTLISLYDKSQHLSSLYMTNSSGISLPDLHVNTNVIRFVLSYDGLDII